MRFALLGFFLLLPLMWNFVRPYFVSQDIASQVKANPSPELPSISELTNEPESTPSKQVETYKLMQKRFHSGDYEAALELALTLLNDKMTPDQIRGRLEQELPVIITSVGWLKIGQDQCAEAIGLFESAIDKKPLADAYKGLALCFYKQKEWARAKFHLEKHLDLSNRNVEGLRLYASTLENLQWYDDALMVWKEIDKASPGKENQQKIKSLEAVISAQPATVVFHSGIFRIEYAPEYHEDILITYVEILQNALDEFVSTAGFRIPDKPIEVVLYNHQDFHKVFHYGPEWAQGLFDGRMRIPVGKTSLAGARRILRHELVHALFADNSPTKGLPSWFSEGIAQRLECQVSSPCQNFIWPPQPGKFLTIRDLEKPYVRLTALKAKRAYQQSLYLIQALEHLKTIDDPLRQLITNGINKRQNISSNKLMNGIRLEFSDLRTKAAAFWSNQESFGNY